MMYRHDFFTTLGLPLLTMLLVAGSATARTLADIKHVHGIEIADSQQDLLLLGTHQGVYQLNRSGEKQRISTDDSDYMAFVANPVNPKSYYGSGHPRQGGNLGLVASDDGGRHWQQLSGGINGPVDFHHLAVSGADPKRIYGDYKGLQISSDGGNSWQQGGKLPDKTYSLAASAIDTDRLYAASQKGLLMSSDAGQSWQPMLMQRLPATAVNVTPQGQLFAYVVGLGLMSSDERKLDLQPLSNNLGARVLMKLAADGDHLYGLDNRNSLWRSTDGGVNWDYYLLRKRSLSETEERGRQLFQTYCQACHSENATGESYTVQNMTEKGYIRAPALDGSAHGWHHLDDQLVQTILNGPPRKSRMPAWKQALSERDARDAIAYFKSFWGKRELDCQGPKHMQCM